MSFLLLILTKSLPREIERAAVRLLFEAISAHAVAFAFTPRPQTHAQPLRHSFGRRRFTVAQLKLACLPSGHQDEWDLESSLRLIQHLPVTSFKCSLPLYRPLVPLLQPRGNLQTLTNQSSQLPSKAKIAHSP